jgi:hypothetical protein
MSLDKKLSDAIGNLVLDLNFFTVALRASRYMNVH